MKTSQRFVTDEDNCRPPLHASYKLSGPVVTQICEYVQGCFICQQNKHLRKHPAGKLVPLQIPEYPWEWVTADCLTNLPLDFSEVLLTMLS